MNTLTIEIIAVVIGAILSPFFTKLDDAFLEWIKKMWHKIRNRDKSIPHTPKKVVVKISLKKKLSIEITIIICAFFALISGGGIWNLSNRLFGWTFFMGGSGNEPYGWYSLYWGFVTLIPIPLMCFIIVLLMNGYTKHNTWKAIAFTILYGILGGLAACLFYNTGLRSIIESFHFNYGTQEIYIVFLWSAILSSVTFFPFILFNNMFKKIISIPWMAIQILLAVILATLFVYISYLFPWSDIIRDQLRGFLAGLGLRLGLFVGLFSSLVRSHIIKD
jgi:hypothetical protein